MFDTMHNAVYGSGLFGHCSLYKAITDCFNGIVLSIGNQLCSRLIEYDSLVLVRFYYTAAISEPFRTVAIHVQFGVLWFLNGRRKISSAELVSWLLPELSWI